MKLVRTFHPVGHGAFYTERFYENYYGYHRDECVFSVVYDCGCSSEKLIKEQVEAYISDPANLHNNKIDVLFISHLHKDHIIGIPYLANICEKIYMPFLTPVQKVAEYVNNVVNDDGLGTEANRIITDIYVGDLRSSGKIVEVLPAEEIGNIDEPVVNENYSVDIMSWSDKLAVHTPLKNDYVPFWIHYPFHLSYNLPDDFKQFFINEGVIVENDVNFDALRKLCVKKRDEIAELYRNEIGDLNEYSMTVYSGFNRLHLDKNSNVYCKIYEEERYRECLFSPNCMFTGDFVASNVNVPKLIGFYGDYFKKSPLLQVPHHGSSRVNRGVYDYRILDWNKVAVMSLDFAKYPDKIPSKELLVELIKRNICTKCVTQDSDSVFRMKYDYCW